MKKIRAKIIDDNNIIYFTNKDMKIKKKDNYNLSVIPISNNGIVVSLMGFCTLYEKNLLDLVHFRYK